MIVRLFGVVLLLLSVSLAHAAQRDIFATSQAGCSAYYEEDHHAVYYQPTVSGNVMHWYTSDATTTGDRWYCTWTATCPSGLVANASGQCKEACPTNSSIPASDPSCGQDPNPCQGKSGSDNWYASNAGAGGPYCDGQCEFDLSLIVESGTQCFEFEGESGAIFCKFAQNYSGEQCSNSSTPTASPDSPTPETTHEQISCPAGYSPDAATGLCKQPGTPGTPSTSTSPGTPGTADQYACPVGYTAEADGNCYKQGDSSIGCPNGYTRNEQGICTAQATLPSGSGTGEGTGTDQSFCGAAGQPACPEIGSSQNQSQIDGIGAAATDAFQQHTGRTELGWNFPGIELPAVSCESLKWSVLGVEHDLNLCPALSRVRDALAYLLYGLAAIYLWRRSTASVGGTK